MNTNITVNNIIDTQDTNHIKHTVITKQTGRPIHTFTPRIMKAISMVLCMVILVIAVVPAYADTDNGAYIDKYEDFVNFPRSTEGYVERLYRGLLNREPDTAGLQSWSIALKRRQENAVSIFYKFVHSTEFERLTRGNELHYIYAVYKTVHGSLDTLSRKTAIEWKTKLDSKVWTRDKILEHVLNTIDFLEGANYANVKWVDTFRSKTYTDQNEKVASLILSLYDAFLDKSADRVDRKDIEEWCRKVRYDIGYGDTVVMDFYNKGRWDTRKVSDETFVRTVYRGVLRREVDSSGFNNCMSALKAGKSRAYILDSIIHSVEFSAFCVDCGLYCHYSGN